jgi:hypothetical protein
MSRSDHYEPPFAVGDRVRVLTGRPGAPIASATYAGVYTRVLSTVHADGDPARVLRVVHTDRIEPALSTNIEEA